MANVRRTIGNLPTIVLHFLMQNGLMPKCILARQLLGAFYYVKCTKNVFLHQAKMLTLMFTFYGAKKFKINTKN